MSSQKSETEPNLARRRAGTFVALHTLLLTAFLVALRLHKLELRGVELTLLQRWGASSGDIGLTLLLQVPWLLTIRSAWARRFYLWGSLYLLSHLPLYVLSITGHRYFLETGVVQNGTMVLYILGEIAGSGAVLGAGIDRHFFTLVVLVLAILFGLGLVAWRRIALVGSAHIALPLAFLGLALCALFLPPSLPPSVRMFGGNWLSDLLPHPKKAALLQAPVLDWLKYKSPQIDAQKWRTSYSRQDEKNAVGARQLNPPHILLVLLESTRRDLFAAYGGAARKSPRLGQFVQNATVVENAYVALSHTTKSLVAIHCGTYPTLTIAMHETKPSGIRMACLPHLLGQLGYDSHFFQSAGNFENRAQLLENLGYAKKHLPTQVAAATATRRGYLGWDESLFVEELLEHLEKRTSPTLTTLLTLTTHHPYTARTSLPRDPKAVRRLYEDAALAVDRAVGAALLQARSAGLLDDTIVITTGDHGESFGDRVGFRQHDLVPYEEVTRVPLFLEGPGIEPRKKISGLRHHIDLLPTLLELLQVNGTGVLPGKSLLSSAGHEFVVSSCWYESMCMSLRTGDISYAFFFGVSPLRAYDLRRDPFQRHNIIDAVPLSTQDLVVKTMLGTRHGSLAHFLRNRPAP